MIGSYIKTSGRSIVRNKLFSFINIVGLAISMSAGLLMIAFLSDLLSYDNFHDKKDRIYRMITINKYLDREPWNMATSSVRAGELVKEDVPGFEEVTIIGNGFTKDGQVGDKIIPFDGKWADENFFNVFSFPVLKGNQETALKEPYSIVLTEKTARKFFGDEDAFGKSIRFDTIDYIVTAVMKDIPKFSHVSFDGLVSLSTEKIVSPKLSQWWNDIWSHYTYVVVDKSADLNTIQVNFDKISQKENLTDKNTVIKLRLQPLKDIVVGPDLGNQIGPTMVISVIWISAGLAFVVILSACFNYTNLSIARSLRRSREVGIRKVVGALKSHVLMQFIAEAIIISLLALVCSFMIFLLLRPQFLSVAPELEDMVTLELSPKVIVAFITLAVVVGILAGFLPALFFAKLNAAKVLKDISSVKVFGHLSMRKALVVIQYTLSLAFITTSVVGFFQYRSFLNFDLGFSTENILNIRLHQNSGKALMKELGEMPEVTAMSRSLLVTSVGSYYGTKLKYNSNKDSADLWFNSVDEKYVPVHGHKLIAGRNFTARPDEPEKEVIVNEQVVQLLSPKDPDPQKVIGETILVDKKEVTIVGVVTDFHYGTVDSKIEPLALRTVLQDKEGYVNVKIVSSDIKATMDKIESIWKKMDSVHPLDATFYDDQIEKAYSKFSAMLKMIGFLAFLAICIASMGLLGMVVFITETRLKEISIRKALGATEGNLIYIMSRGFILLLGISAMIALPGTYFFFKEVVLPNFPYSPPVGLELFAGLLVVLAIAVLMIGSQTFKMARTNPAKVLKNE